MSLVSYPTRRRRKVTASRSEIVASARAARFALARVSEKVQARRREVLLAEGESLEPQVIEMTEAERVEALQTALVWLQRAENETRRLRGLLERQMDRETKEAF